MRKIFLFLLAAVLLLCSVSVSTADQDSQYRYGYADQYGVYITDEEGNASYIWFWHEQARQFIMGDLTAPGTDVRERPADASDGKYFLGYADDAESNWSARQNQGKTSDDPTKDPTDDPVIDPGIDPEEGEVSNFKVDLTCRYNPPGHDPVTHSISNFTTLTKEGLNGFNLGEIGHNFCNEYIEYTGISATFTVNCPTDKPTLDGCMSPAYDAESLSFCKCLGCPSDYTYNSATRKCIPNS